MAIRTELTLRLQNSPGSLARVCALLSDERVNVIALGLDSTGLLRLVVDNHVHALGVLREREYQVDDHDVLYVQVPNDPGACAAVARSLAGAGVNIDYLYATALEGQPMAALVIGVADPQRASTAAGL